MVIVTGFWLLANCKHHKYLFALEILSFSRGFSLEAVCSFLLRAVPALWTDEVSKYLVGRHCRECVISTYLTNLPWNHSHNLCQNSFVCLWRQSVLAKGLVMQTAVSRRHALAHHHPSAEHPTVCGHDFSWPLLPRMMCKCLCLTHVTLHSCRTRACTYFVQLGYNCFWVFLVSTEIIKDFMQTSHLLKLKGYRFLWKSDNCFSVQISSISVFILLFFSLKLFFPLGVIKLVFVVVPAVNWEFWILFSLV